MWANTWVIQEVTLQPLPVQEWHKGADIPQLLCCWFDFGRQFVQARNTRLSDQADAEALAWARSHGSCCAHVCAGPMNTLAAQGVAHLPDRFWLQGSHGP